MRSVRVSICLRSGIAVRLGQMRFGDPIAATGVGHEMDWSVAGIEQKAVRIYGKQCGPHMLAGRAFLTKERATAGCDQTTAFEPELDAIIDRSTDPSDHGFVGGIFGEINTILDEIGLTPGADSLVKFVSKL